MGLFRVLANPVTYKKAIQLALAMKTVVAKAETMQSTSSQGGAQELGQPILRMQLTHRGGPSGNKAAGVCYRCSHIYNYTGSYSFWLWVRVAIKYHNNCPVSIGLKPFPKSIRKQHTFSDLETLGFA